MKEISRDWATKTLEAFRTQGQASLSLAEEITPVVLVEDMTVPPFSIHRRWSFNTSVQADATHKGWIAVYPGSMFNRRDQRLVIDKVRVHCTSNQTFDLLIGPDGSDSPTGSAWETDVGIPQPGGTNGVAVFAKGGTTDQPGGTSSIIDSATIPVAQYSVEFLTGPWILRQSDTSPMVTTRPFLAVKNQATNNSLFDVTFGGYVIL